MNRAWLWVLVGGVAETAWAVFMKMSDGFTDLFYDALVAVFMAISLYMLNRGFRAGLPTGVCYAVWTGIGAIGSVVVGTLFMGEGLGIVSGLFLMMIIAGVIGLNLAPEKDVTSRGRSGRGCRSPCRRGRRTRRWAPWS